MLSLKKVKYYLLRIRTIIIQKKNWYFPNFLILNSGRIIIKGNKILCNQYTMITGEGSVVIGDSCSFGHKLGGSHRHGSIEIQPRYVNSKIVIGNNLRTNNNIFICAANYIEIGDNAIIGENVTIMDHEAHGVESDKRKQLGDIGSVCIKENVWLGNNVVVLKNVSIGKNSIIAAGAIVTSNVPENVIAGGIPCRIIKNL